MNFQALGYCPLMTTSECSCISRSTAFSHVVIFEWRIPRHSCDETFDFMLNSYQKLSNTFGEILCFDSGNVLVLWLCTPGFFSQYL